MRVGILLLVASEFALGQTPGQNPNTPPPPGSVYSEVPPKSGKGPANPTQPAPNPTKGKNPTTPSQPPTTGKNPTGGNPTTPIGKNPGGTIPGRGRGPTSTGNRGGGSSVSPPHGGNGGGNSGAIAAGAVGAAAVGVGIFEALHHAHAPNGGQSVQRLGLSLRYPPDWQLNPRLSQEDDPISLNTFKSSYLAAGIIPMGGADIDIAYFPNVTTTPRQLIARELTDASQQQIDGKNHKVGKQDGTRVFYTDIYARGFVYKNTAIYVARGGGLYKFFLTYHEGDAHEKAFNDDFDYIVKSVRFEK